MAKGGQFSHEIEKKKKLINQFNYCERAVLTLNNPPRVIMLKSFACRSNVGEFCFQVCQFIVCSLDNWPTYRMLKLKLFRHHDRHSVHMCCSGSFTIRMRKISNKVNVKRRKNARFVSPCSA